MSVVIGAGVGTIVVRNRYGKLTYCVRTGGVATRVRTTSLGASLARRPKSRAEADSTVPVCDIKSIRKRIFEDEPPGTYTSCPLRRSSASKCCWYCVRHPR